MCSFLPLWFFFFFLENWNFDINWTLLKKSFEIASNSLVHAIISLFLGRLPSISLNLQFIFIAIYVGNWQPFKLIWPVFDNNSIHFTNEIVLRLNNFFFFFCFNIANFVAGFGYCSFVEIFAVSLIILKIVLTEWSLEFTDLTFQGIEYRSVSQSDGMDSRSFSNLAEKF